MRTDLESFQMKPGVVVRGEFFEGLMRWRTPYCFCAAVSSTQMNFRCAFLFLVTGLSRHSQLHLPETARGAGKGTRG